MNYDARNIVLNILTEVFGKARFLNDACDEAFRAYPDLQDRDRRFILKLSKGVTERKITLDAVLQNYSSVPLQKMKPAVRLILCMGLYQILFMETEAYAAVSESVKLTVKRGYSGLRGFVNGVLRKVSSEKEQALSKLYARERCAVPEFLWDSFVSWYGAETAERIFRYMLSEESEKLYVRRNTQKVTEEALTEMLSDEGASLVPTGFSEDTYVLHDRSSLTGLQAFRDGLFYVQDLSSALSGEPLRALCAAAGPDFSVLDVCAAPGGKSLHVADMLGKKGQILSCDVSERKTALIRENAVRAGAENIEVRVQDASEFVPAFEHAFDLVIADVPCSGLGIIGGKPDIKYHVTAESLASLLELQKKILNHVIRYVKPGGVLMFSTCTVNPAENTGNRDQILRTDSAFSLKCERQFLPGLDPCDGFYYAMFEKKRT